MEREDWSWWSAQSFLAGWRGKICFWNEANIKKEIKC